MQMKRQKYTPQICAPYYSDARQSGAVLHRYLDDQFISRFANQAQANQLSQDNHQWIDEDRFVDKKYPCLRLPVHRTFYVICCEACCNAPGQPALDPSRIESAGFVIRQQVKGKDLRWMLRDGLDKGWEVPQNPGIDEPDEYRYLLNKGYTEARSPEPAYSGEMTYPLSPTLVKKTLSKPERSHTLLYGFVPLGGQSYPSASEVDKPLLSEVMNELIWPVGTYQRSSWIENSAQHSGHLIQNGRLEQAAAELILLLVERFHIFDSDNNTENSELITLLRSIFTYRGGSSGGHKSSNYEKSFNFHSYLLGSKNRINNWIAAYHSLDSDLSLANSKQRLQSNLQLFITEDQANDLRLLLARRSLGVIELALSDLPEPRYQRDGLYYAKVFLRYVDEKGCKKIVWGPSSIAFRVAAPFDPQASRPQLIQMPGLDDLKRGLANGAVLRAPKSLSDVIERIKPDLGEPGERPPKSRGGDGGWMYVFSIPIITIVAMILLMVMVSLLNFIFRWIPWVIQRIPIPK